MDHLHQGPAQTLIPKLGQEMDLVEIDDAHVFVRDAKKNMNQLSSANHAKGLDDKILPKGVLDLPFPAGTKEMAAAYAPIISAPSKRVTSPFAPRD